MYVDVVSDGRAALNSLDLAAYIFKLIVSDVICNDGFPFHPRARFAVRSENRERSRGLARRLEPKTGCCQINRDFADGDSGSERESSDVASYLRQLAEYIAV